MGLNNITFRKAKGGLGRPLPGEDHISGFCFYSASLPTGFSASDRIKVVTSLVEAETLGIAKGSANLGVFHYHISEFFRLQPKGVLYVGLFALPAGAYDFAEVTTLQNFAVGKLRQVGVFVSSTVFVTGMVTALQSIATALESVSKPLQLLLGADISATPALSGLPDLRTLNAPNVSVVIGQDGGAVGKGLYQTTTKSVTCLGALLGAVSLASVNENIGWVEKFNMANVELDVVAFANGVTLRETTEATMEQLHNKGYIFLLKHVGEAGTHFHDSPTCTDVTSDYAFIENNRTMDKAIRGIRKFLLPKLNSPLFVNPDGTLSEDTIAVFEGLAKRPLEQMERDREVSTFEVIISPIQNVLSTSKLSIYVKVVPTGVARAIETNIGFTVKI